MTKQKAKEKAFRMAMLVLSVGWDEAIRIMEQRCKEDDNEAK